MACTVNFLLGRGAVENIKVAPLGNPFSSGNYSLYFVWQVVDGMDTVVLVSIKAFLIPDHVRTFEGIAKNQSSLKAHGFKR